VLKLIGIGVLAGLFSALFGVGGGVVIVPLLLLYMAFSERPAMGTSLVAIGVISAVGAISYGLHGDLKPGAAMLVGLPGAVGSIAGTALQQRLPTRALSYGFAALLVGVAIRLLV
jgi:uncharacterized membrane protein YfcA